MSKAVARAQEVEIQEEIDEDELMLSPREERSRLLCLGLERVLVLGVTLVEDSDGLETRMAGHSYGLARGKHHRGRCRRGANGCLIHLLYVSKGAVLGDEPTGLYASQIYWVGPSDQQTRACARSKH